MEPRFFSSQTEFEDWLAGHHDSVDELWIGFNKVGSGLGGLGYREALDLALAYGWIDAVRKSIDDKRYKIRFTPRRKGSIWSRINVNRVEELLKDGAMKPSGVAVFEGRKKEGVYSYENAPREFDAELKARFMKHHKAWEFFSAQPPSYRRVAVWWVVSAKRAETREKRLGVLIADSEKGVRSPQVMGGETS